MVMSDNQQHLDVSKWEKETSELFAFIYDSRKSFSTTQLLTVYRESMLLLGKYQLEMKKKGQEINEHNASVSLSLFRKILEEVNKLTQDESNDSMIQENAMTKSIFLNL